MITDDEPKATQNVSGRTLCRNHEQTRAVVDSVAQGGADHAVRLPVAGARIRVDHAQIRLLSGVGRNVLVVPRAQWSLGFSSPIVKLVIGVVCRQTFPSMSECNPSTPG